MNAAVKGPGRPRSEWVNAVRRGDTDLSYQQWVEEQKKVDDSTPSLHNLTTREVNQILAALRFWQSHPGHPVRFTQLASDNGSVALTSAEIDTLCENMNMPQSVPVIAYALTDPDTGALVTLGRHKPGKAAYKRWNVQRLVGVA